MLVILLIFLLFRGNSMKSSYKLNSYANVKPKKISWLWYPYIPYGKITLVQGDPGEGKTTMMLQIAADVTTGRIVPGGKSTTRPQNVILQSTEDGLGDTIKPRLDKAGADCSKVFYLEPLNNNELSLADHRFEDAIIKQHAKLLIIDPLQSFLNTDTDMNKVVGMRKSFISLSKIAERTGCAVVIIGHMNKGCGGKGIYRGLGSIDIAAISRSILLVGRDQNNPEIRAVVPIKSSLAPEGSAYAFILSKENGFQWIGECDYTEDELLGNVSYGAKQHKARNILRTLLLKEDRKSSELFEQMEMLGISKRTVELVKKDMNIKAYKRQNAWYWTLRD